MAKSESKEIKVPFEKVVVDYKTEKVVALELSEAEAKALVAVLWKVGGEPSGPRGLTSDVLEALEEQVGQPADRTEYWNEWTRNRSGLCFEKGVTREKFVEMFDGYRARKFSRD